MPTSTSISAFERRGEVIGTSASGTVAGASPDRHVRSMKPAARRTRSGDPHSPGEGDKSASHPNRVQQRPVDPEAVEKVPSSGARGGNPPISASGVRRRASRA